MWVFDPQNTKIVFLGSKTHFFISDTYISHSELICYVILHPQNWFIIIPDMGNRLFRWKNGYLTPKTWFLVFLGHMPIFSWGAHTFLFLKGFVIGFEIFLDNKNGPFRLKCGYLTPKTLKSCFWGLKPIFSLVTPTSFILNWFVMWFYIPKTDLSSPLI